MEENNIKEEAIKNEEPKEPILVTNHTDFTEAGFNALNKVIAKKIYLLVFLAEIAIFAIGAICFVRAIYVVGGVVIGLGVFYPLFLYFINKAQVKRSYLIRKDAYEDSSYLFEFSKEKLYVTFTTKKAVRNGTLIIGTFHSLVETNEYIFIFAGSKISYILDKKGFENGEDIEKLHKIIEECGVKYRKNIKKN